MSIKKLAGQTAVYGLSSIIGRLLYFFLTPLYTRVFDKSDYGVMTDLFAFIGILFIFYTYRMETAYFRYASDHESLRNKTFDTAILSVGIPAMLWSVLIFLGADSIAEWFRYPEYAYIIQICAGILFLDALAELPLSRLRLEGKAMRFATIRLISIGVNIALNLFFLLLCPYWLGDDAVDKGWGWLYNPDIGIGYIFIANLVASLLTLLLLSPMWLKLKFDFDKMLMVRMFRYALPLIIVGFSFVINEMFDRKIMIWLLSGTEEENKSVLGSYGAAYKLTMILALFTQAFRYGAEPFFFQKKNAENAKELYADVTKYYFIFGLTGCLFTLLFIDLFKHILDNSYWMALGVIPVLLLANLLNGLYYNVSIWYRLTDRTMSGAWIGLTGAAITIALNIWWLPIFGYWGAAFATLICYSAMLIICYLQGQKHYKVPYDLKLIGMYFLIGSVVYGISAYLNELLQLNLFLTLLINAVLFGVFILFVLRQESMLMGLARKLRSRFNSST
jgi:O-antigen/teichoic acid export membrane protein